MGNSMSKLEQPEGTKKVSKGCIHSQEKERLELAFQKLVKAKMADLAQEKSLLDRKKKEIERKLDDMKEIIKQNKENNVGEAARLIEMQLEEKDDKIWNEAFQKSSSVVGCIHTDFHSVINQFWPHGRDKNV